MQVNGQLHAAVVLRFGGEDAVPIEWGVTRAPEKRNVFCPLMVFETHTAYPRSLVTILTELSRCVVPSYYS